LSTICNIVCIRILIRNTNDYNEYLNGLESELSRILSLIQKYRDTQKHGEELKRYKKALEQYKELDEKDKRLGHILESIHRLRTQTEREDPPIDLGNGKVLVSIEDPMAW
jgi:septation ring formation regulator EzrA